MFFGSSPAKELLTITPCRIDNGAVKVLRSPSFEVMLNPNQYSRKYAINYNEPQTQGKTGNPAQFAGYSGERFSVKFVLDGTGVVPGSSGVDVQDEVEALMAIAYSYDGSEHQPRPVSLTWGTLSFIGRTTSLDVDYTMFKASGRPLRASISLSLIEYSTVEEARRRANRSSPDLSHRVVFQAGDTLPLLCHQIYKDSAYYVDVAAFNGIDNFRDITPGTVLLFPRLE